MFPLRLSPGAASVGAHVAEARRERVEQLRGHRVAPVGAVQREEADAGALADGAGGLVEHRVARDRGLRLGVDGHGRAFAQRRGCFKRG